MRQRYLIALPFITFFALTAALADWNGGYAGITGGSVSDLSFDVTTNIDPDVDFEDGTSFGVFFGGHANYGTYVIGYEIAFESFNDALEFDGDVTADYALDLKLSAGIPLQDLLFYGIFGVSTISGDYGPNEIGTSGLSYGTGAAFKLGEQFSLGAEYLVRDTTDEFVLTDLDAEATSLNARIAFHF
ncbi:MAG: outer membrane beta-barrel protein [Pseudomonadota bacterium]